MQCFFNLWRRSFCVPEELTSVDVDASQRQLSARPFESAVVCDHGDKVGSSHMRFCGPEFGETRKKSIAIIVSEEFLKVCEGIPRGNPE